jgi:hypothetical protein
MENHAYISSAVAAMGLLMVGGFIVVNNSAVSPRNEGDTWGSGAVVTPIHTPEAPSETRVTPQMSDPALGAPISPFALGKEGKEGAENAVDNPALNWDSIKDALSPKTSTPQPPATDSSLLDQAYSYIPTGLTAPASPSKPLSDADRALYAYGNNAGSVVKSYEAAYPNQASILTDHIQDRYGPSKIAAMKQMANDLIKVGDELDSIPTTPPEIGLSGKNLANAYRDIGKNLARIPDAKNDKEFLSAVHVYNSSAESFVQKYVNLVLVFQANGIRFSLDEPGSVFMFPAN